MKKFTDGEFCSAEHRTLFYDTQQKLIVERLAASARKLNRYKLLTKQQQPVPPPVVIAVEPMPVPRAEEILPPFAASVPIAVLDALIARNNPYQLAVGFPFSTPDLPLIPPSSFCHQKKERKYRLASPAPTFLAAKSSKLRERIEVKAGAPTPPALAIPHLIVAGGFHSPGMRSAAIARRHPARTEPIGKLSFAEHAFTGELSGFGGEVSRPGRDITSAASGGIQTHGKWMELHSWKPCDSVSASRRAAVVPASQNNAPAIPNFAPHALQVHGVNEASKTFRVRPRGPVADSSTAQFFPIEPNPIAAAPAGFRGSLALPTDETAVELPGPAICSRFFRARARGPLASPGILESERIPSDIHPFAATHTTIPALGATGSAEGTSLRSGRFLRMRPRGPVLGGGADSLAAHSSDAEALTSPVRLPSCGVASVGTLEPRFLERGFRMRPRAAVTREGLATLEPVVPHPVQSPPSDAAKPSLPAAVIGQYAPSLVDRHFRARPRGPVLSAALASFEKTPAGEPGSLASRPSFGPITSALIGELFPRAVQRFYRIRPKSAVECAALSLLEKIAPGVEPLLSSPKPGGLPRSVVGDFTPIRVERFFRARPRGPVENRVPQTLEQIPAGVAAALVSAPATGTLPVHLIGECLPNSLVRFFRARPRSPIDSLSSARHQAIASGPQADLVSSPQLAALAPVVAGPCQPNAVVRFFRARPRGPLEAKTALLIGAAEMAQPLEMKPGGGTAPRLPQIGAGTVQPAFLNNAFRMRPKGGVQDKNLRNYDRIDAGIASALESGPNLGALPPSIIGGLSPQQLDRFYKMRPRGPVQAIQLPAFYRISAGESEVPSRSGQVPQLSSPDADGFQPIFLDRFYRMRPRGPLQTAAGAFELVSSGSPEQLIPRAAIPSMPAVLMRQARTPSRDRGPRNRPPSGPRPNTGTRSLDSREEGEQDTRVPQASKSALPDSILSVWNGPSGWIQFAHPVALESNSSGFPMAANPVSPELFIEAPLFPGELIVDYRPSLVEVRMAYEENHKPTWRERIAAFWSESTWDVKWVTVAVPVLLAVLIHSSLTRLPQQLAPAKMDMAAMASNPIPPLRDVVEAKWFDLRNELVGRAAVDLQEDFSRGLRFWAGDTNWSNSWAYDVHGGVKPGALALYTPTIGMSDYELEFTGEIGIKSLGWAFRAADTRNYYSVKLAVIKPGPLPQVALVRSTVIDGKEGTATQVPLPFTVSNDQLYHVRMEVNGQFFTVNVQGHVVAFWSDERLKTGGIGFYSAKSEQSRLLAVRVTHQFDALGRLCASLALQVNSAKQTGVSRNESQK
ncbi:MAG: hypothetical protein ABJF23_15825 [Bryobacteraceae bacterium]